MIALRHFQPHVVVFRAAAPRRFARLLVTTVTITAVARSVRLCIFCAGLRAFDVRALNTWILLPRIAHTLPTVETLWQQSSFERDPPGSFD